MRITKLILKGYQQFRNLHLDLTDPGTGRALDKVCIIGRNATGKSTILDLIARTIAEASKPLRPVLDAKRSLRRGRSVEQKRKGFLCLGCSVGDRKYLLWGQPGALNSILRGEVEKETSWRHYVEDSEREGLPDSDLVSAWSRDYGPGGENEFQRLQDEFALDAGKGDALVLCPPDGSSLIKGSVPKGRLNEALRLRTEFQAFHRVGLEDAVAFWNILIYRIKQREDQWQQYLNQPENRAKSVEQADRDFQQRHPDILERIADLWNRILEPVGLEFDYRNAKRPVQLNDNLEAYIKLRGNGQQIDYNALSSGIRNFIFRLGHIYSLYFQRDIKCGLLLVDEPENSLHPDFLYDLIDIYLSIISNTQFFVATHSPIIAAQFRPEERIVLEFDEDHFVTAHRGVVPVGDDPNDLLSKDFEVRSLYGKEGLAKWERFLELRRLIKKTTDDQAKRRLIEEYMQIGNAYNFGPDAIS